MRNAIGLVLFLVGALVFAWGASGNTSSTGSVGGFVKAALEDGSIWPCLGGALIAAFGMFTFFNSRLGGKGPKP